MNLRTVHFVLILFSAALAVLMGGWLLQGYGRDGGTLPLLGAGTSFVVAVGLIVYDRWFLQRTRFFG